MFQVESPKGSDSDKLVAKMAMKEDASPLESIPRPTFQCLLAGQKVDLFFIKFAFKFLYRDFLYWLYSFPADMLDRVVGDA